MSEPVAWLLFPAVLVLLGLGCGLLVERLSGARLPGPLLLPLGLASISVVADLLTRLDATAELTAPFVVLLGMLGVLVSWPRVRGARPDGWAFLAAVVPFLAVLAPVVSGAGAAFTGYTVLDDSAVHFSLVEQAFSHGHVLPTDASSFAQSVMTYMSTEYPLGADLPMGVGWRLVGGEVAWLFQPWLGMLLASVGLAVYALLGELQVRRWQRSLVAVIAAQSGLLYAYTLQGSVKELDTVAIFTLVAALCAPFLRSGASLRATIPLAVAAAAGVTVLSLAIVPWIGLPLAVTAGLAFLRASERRRAATALVAGGLLAALLAAPAVLSAGKFTQVASSVLGKADDLGNLARSLDPLQVVGIWPRGDFRLPLVQNQALVYVLIALAVVAAVVGAIHLARRRKLDGVALLPASAALALAFLLPRGSGYADAKTLAVGSIAVTLLGGLGALALLNQPRRVGRVAGAALGLAVAAGVLWTNALAYHGVSMAPHDRFAELARIGHSLDGRGPTLFDEFDEHAKHLLREAGGASSPETVHRYLTPEIAKAETTTKQAHDLDRMDWRYVRRFPRILLRRSPLASRPPSGYVLESSGRYYEVWRRAAAPRILAHRDMSTGGARSCRRIRRLSRRAASEGAELHYALAPELVRFEPATAPVRPPWARDRAERSALRPSGPGLVQGAVVLDGGRYTIWQGGSFLRGVAVRIAGRPAGEVSYELGWGGQYFELGERVLPRGRVRVEQRKPGGDLRGGNGAQVELLSSTLLVRGPPDRRVHRLAARLGSRLCHRRLDWLEAVEP